MAKRRRSSGRPRGRAKRGLPRRRFLLAAAALLLAGVAAWLLSRLTGRPGPAAPRDESLRAGFLPGASVPVFLVVADVIVPRWSGHPAASELPDLFERFEKLFAYAPWRRELYRRVWPDFERLLSQLRSRGPGPDPDLLRPLFEQWYAELRENPAPSGQAQFFERMRKDVLRAYYTSPAGWAALGYPGPARRRHPRGSQAA